MRQIIRSLCLCTVSFFIAGCSTNTHQITLTKYPLQCVSGEIKNSQCIGGKWVAMDPYKMSYTLLLEKQQVVSVFLGELKMYSNCVILDTDNWSCKYDNGSGSFGFRKGTHFEEPGNRMRIHVSRFRWYYTRLANMLGVRISLTG